MISPTRGVVIKKMIVGLLKKIYDLLFSHATPVIYQWCNSADTSGDLIAAPGAGYYLRIHHIYVSNAADMAVMFDLQAGDVGDRIFSFYLTNNGGTVAQNLKRPLDLPENTSLYYMYLSGDFPNVLITIGYEAVAV
jgi:hypothetical protein